MIIAIAMCIVVIALIAQTISAHYWNVKYRELVGKIAHKMDELKKESEPRQ